MIVPAGETNSDRLLGRVADFCPLCRSFQPFRIYEVLAYHHFLYIALSPRTGIGRAKVCETCRLRRSAGTEPYAAISTDRDADLETLIATTNPEIRRNWASRLLLEDRIKARKLTQGERAGLLQEPFAMAAEILARRDLEAKLDLPSSLGCLGSFLLPAACLLLLPLFWKSSSESMELVAVVVGAACVTFTFLAVVTDARRHARRALLPRLVEALRPLDPSVEEIDQSVETLKQASSPLAEVIDARELSNRLLERWD